MNVVEFFSRCKGMEKGCKRREIGGGHWTSDANGGTKYGGWNVEGMKQFNELCQQVKINRTLYPEFENEFLKKVTNQCNKTAPSKHLNDNTIIVYDDMDDTEMEVEVNEV